MTNDHVAALTKVLLDTSAEFGDRDDAAMALASSDSSEAEVALLKLATDTSVDSDLADRCGEGLAHIWSRRGHVDRNTLSSLNRVALRVALATIKALSPILSGELTRQGVNRD
jgi:hypothetical protein